jgi:hypothetical protein
MLRSKLPLARITTVPTTNHDRFEGEEHNRNPATGYTAMSGLASITANPIQMLTRI